MGLLSNVYIADLRRTAVYLIFVPVGFIILKLLQRIYDFFCGPLRNVKGPWLARYTRLWEILAFHKRYGTLLMRTTASPSTSPS